MANVICHKVYELLMSILKILNGIAQIVISSEMPKIVYG
jgi:hypothetical protein